MKKTVKLALIILIAAACAVAGVYYMSMPLTVDVRAVSPETASLTFTEQGVYDYGERKTVYPLVAGEVLEVRVAEGDRVAAGDVLAVVSASDYLYQIEQLNSAIAGYNAQITGVDLQEQQRKDELAASLETLRGQITSLEAEMLKARSDEESREKQIEIQELIIWYNRNGVAAAESSLRDAREWGDDSAINAARTALANAQSVFTQNEMILEQLKSGSVPEDIYEGQLQSLEAQMESISDQMEKSYTSGSRQYYNAQISAARASIAQMQEKAGQAEILATADGIITELPVKDSNLLSQQSPVATIAFDGRIEVFVPIREIDGIHNGDRVELILDRRLGNETVAGTVTKIDDKAEVRLSALGVEERKVRVLIRPQRPVFAIGYGMDVRFTVYTAENALIVPKTAVFPTDSGDCVWLLSADGLLEKRTVVKGIETRDGYIIDEGLSSGELVIADADNTELREGRKAVAG